MTWEPIAILSTAFCALLAFNHASDWVKGRTKKETKEERHARVQAEFKAMLDERKARRKVEDKEFFDWDTNYGLILLPKRMREKWPEVRANLWIAYNDSGTEYPRMKIHEAMAPQRQLGAATALRALNAWERKRGSNLEWDYFD